MMYTCPYCLEEVKTKGAFSRHQAKHVLEDPPKMVATVRKSEGEIFRAVYDYKLAKGIRRGSGKKKIKKKPPRDPDWTHAYRT